MLSLGKLIDMVNIFKRLLLLLLPIRLILFTLKSKTIKVTQSCNLGSHKQVCQIKIPK